MPVRGNLSNTFVRKDLNPVSLPSQKGELVLRAKTCGRKYLAELAICMAISFDRHTHMYMEAKDQVAPGGFLHFIYNFADSEHDR